MISSKSSFLNTNSHVAGLCRVLTTDLPGRESQLKHRLTLPGEIPPLLWSWPIPTQWEVAAERCFSGGLPSLARACGLSKQGSVVSVCSSCSHRLPRNLPKHTRAHGIQDPAPASVYTGWEVEYSPLRQSNTRTKLNR